MCVFNSKYPLFGRYLLLFGALFANIIINFKIKFVWSCCYVYLSLTTF